jgi:hypothetical protein
MQKMNKLIKIVGGSDLSRCKKEAEARYGMDNQTGAPTRLKIS